MTGLADRARTGLRARLDPTSYLGLHLTIGFVLAAVGLWLFGALLDAVLDQATLVQWDQVVAGHVHALTTPIGLGAFDAITQLGSPAFMAMVALAGLLVIWRAGAFDHRARRALLVGWVAAFAGDVLANEVVKLLVRRARPIYGARFLHGHTYSFPSGHAMGSIVGYGMLAYLVSRLDRRWRRLAIVVAVVLVLLIGVSRIYLGVHWPSDVLGGWAAGGAWLAVCLTGLDLVRRRRTALDAALDAARAAAREVADR